MNRYSNPVDHWCDGSTVEFWFTFPIYSVGSIVLALKDGWGFALLFVILWCVYLCMACYCFTFIFVMFRPRTPQELLDAMQIDVVFSFPAREFLIRQSERYQNRGTLRTR